MSRLSHLAYFALIAFSTALIFKCGTVAADQSNPEPSGSLPLYIPVSGEDFPNLSRDLNIALAQAGLSHYRAQTTDYWHQYQQGLRMGRKGIYLAAPHFASWAIHQHSFVPVLKLEDDISYVVAARRRDLSVFEMADLNGRNVCVQPGLNLDFLLISGAFTNPLHSARTRTFSNVAKLIEKEAAINETPQECAAFATTNHVFQAYNKKYPERLIRLQQSINYPPYVWVAQPEVVSAKLSQFLRSSEAVDILTPALKRFSNGDRLNPAAADDYPVNLSELLEPFWGR